MCGPRLSVALWWGGLAAAAGVSRLLSEPTKPLSVPGETIPSCTKQTRRRDGCSIVTIILKAWPDCQIHLFSLPLQGFTAV